MKGRMEYGGSHTGQLFLNHSLLLLLLFVIVVVIIIILAENSLGYMHEH